MPDAGRTSVFSIPPGVAFVDALAQGLVDRYGETPAQLSAVQVLLPTRRACRALGEAFLRANGGEPTLLPAMTSIGDIDEDEIEFAASEEAFIGLAGDLPPAIPPLRRQLLLTRMILAGDPDISAAHAARLALELARLLDEVQIHRLDFSNLSDVVPERFSAHWQDTLSFLHIVTESWPAILAEQDCLDPSERRNRLIEAQIVLWEADAPDGPVIAAGSTGSVPATADLLSCVANMPNGSVVLPGLDICLDEKSNTALAPSHPQYGMMQLLKRLRVEPREVVPWEEGSKSPSRRGMGRFSALNTALRPPETAQSQWSGIDVEAAFSGVGRIDCPGLQQEALVIALIMREVLNDPAATAALVTPDRRLARRVAAELRRWNIDIDDSGGAPLSNSVPGVFLRLLANAASVDAGPIDLLAALKHPLAAGGQSVAAFRDQVRRAEILALRGPRPLPGFAGLAQALESCNGDAALVAWARELAASAQSFAALMRSLQADPAELLDAQIRFAEFLAATDQATGVERLWAGDAGENAAALFNDMRASINSLPRLSGREWPALLDTLLKGSVVRPRYGRHPRLNIWGLLEARLQQADVMIFGGLNEGVWPPAPASDPWMSRPMRAAFGLPSPERRVGLTAHDFVQGFAAPQVVLTRSTRVDGSPTVPARWLTRLDTMLSADEAGQRVRNRWTDLEHRWLDWQERLDGNLPAVPAAAPRPTPPVEARPLNLSITDIETLIRDPYAIYAKRILKLRRLDSIDADPGAADRGSIIHDAIDTFLREIADGPLPEDALDRLLRIGSDAFAPWIDRPGIRAFWWPRFERIAAWVVDLERNRAADVAKRHTEISGAYEFVNRCRPFTLTGRADRIDELAAGGLEIIDYKTGAVPAKKEVNQGIAPQLPLEAALIERGAFPDIPQTTASALTYWRLSGGDPPGETRAAGDDPARLSDEAFEGLTALLDLYDDPATSYPARPNAEIAPRHNDYEDLERVQEWAAASGGE
jgi:ATP-dependent helicase/nuclease subunit B